MPQLAFEFFFYNYLKNYFIYYLSALAKIKNYESVPNNFKRFHVTPSLNFKYYES